MNIFKLLDDQPNNPLTRALKEGKKPSMFC